MFSSRVAADLRPNRIATARAAFPPRWDLTVSNPTCCGLDYPSALLARLADPAGQTYRPDPLGVLSARQAVAAEYVRWGGEIAADRVVLTASTSEAYSFLFKLLCGPGDAVLSPSPSYPLFEHLAQLESVAPVVYRLDEEAGWRLDMDELRTASDQVRAVIVVHPNNPTGSYLHPDDRETLTRECARRGGALIVGEAFLDFPLDGGPGAGTSLATGSECLTFCLGGLSKSCGLPQLKLSWIAVGGPEPLVAAALARLEVIADTYLSVATPVQLALPDLLLRGAAVRRAIHERCIGNLASLRNLVARCPEIGVLAPGGGWCAVIRVPSVVDEEELAVCLLTKDRVAIHPGFFFDFPREGYLVASLLPDGDTFREGVERLLGRVTSYL
jgi:alanine-synthesizing transaminase